MKIRALCTPALGQTADDLLALALLGQHERAAIDCSRADAISGLVQITLDYADGVGAGEVQDVKDRLERIPCQGVDLLP